MRRRVTAPYVPMTLAIVASRRPVAEALSARAAPGIGAAGALAIAADLARAPQAGAVRALIDEEPAAALRLAAAETGGVPGGEKRRQRHRIGQRGSASALPGRSWR